MIATILAVLFLTKGMHNGQEILDNINAMNYEEILIFYQKEIPKEAFEETKFMALVKSFMVEEDLLNDIENLYNVASKKTPDTDC